MTWGLYACRAPLCAFNMAQPATFIKEFTFPIIDFSDKIYIFQIMPVIYMSDFFERFTLRTGIGITNTDQLDNRHQTGIRMRDVNILIIYLTDTCKKWNEHGTTKKHIHRGRPWNYSTAVRLPLFNIGTYLLSLYQNHFLLLLAPGSVLYYQYYQ